MGRYLKLWLVLLCLSLSVTTSWARQVSHALGVTVINGQPKRVVTLFQGATDTAVALGITPVGVVDSWIEKPMYRYLRSALGDVPHVGLETQPNLEAIALLKPDLIIASRFRHERVYTLLSQIAPTVAMEDVFEFKRTVQLMGQALGRETQAQGLLTAWQGRVSVLRDRLRAHYGSQWPLRVSLIEFRDDHIRQYLARSFAGSVLSEVGFIWPGTQADPLSVMRKLSTPESLPVLDADLFFVFMRSEKPAVTQLYRTWTAHPLWQRLTAPQRERVYTVDSVAWSLSGGILGANRILDEIVQRLLPVETTP
ncbi:iron-siderophore ABC transporter substrate-binding protein [Candidatus Symbiopectobacterium sp. NZEC135]|nr:iron-siderophore ABC transporter substrate-binding protein [Candidatus Symbiopectobacterium sp. NZEC135]MCW2479773.1 iron-siderophore ABC transporter substrate-binding protein [Candidatus Symbiopectobacterium sp. NZEC135]